MQPTLLDKTLNHFQAWAIENPQNPVSRTFLPIISFVEGTIANNPPYLDRKRQVLGDAFCCAGEVVLGDFKTLETALTSPQAPGGFHFLNSSRRKSETFTIIRSFFRL
jgi:hypothetical protein